MCRAEHTSECSAVQDLFEYVDMAIEWEGAGLDDAGFGDSDASPLGSSPSANHTLLCSRVRVPEDETITRLQKTACKQTLIISSISNISLKSLGTECHCQM